MSSAATGPVLVNVTTKAIVSPAGGIPGLITSSDVGTVTDTMGAFSVKPAVAVVAASNLTKSGEQTIDGQTTSASLVLLTAQTTGSENGPWVTAAGAWSRPGWFTNGSTTQAPQFCTTFVRLGTTYQGSVWRMTTASVTIGTTSQTWVQTPLAFATLNGSTKLTTSGFTTGSGGAMIGADASGNFTLSTAGSTNTLSIVPAAGTFTVTGPGSAGQQLATLAGTEALSNKSITASSFSGTTIAGTSSITLGVASATAGTVILKNATSTGNTTLTPGNASSTNYTVTVPAATDTLVGKATTDTLTNKTFDTAGTGNSFSINGVAATANTGTGSMVRATSPTLTTPAIGAATGTSLALGGATLGSNALALTGNATIFAGSTIAGGLIIDGSAYPGVTIKNGATIAGYWAYVTNAAGYFTDSLAGDLIFLTQTASSRVLFGQGSGASALRVGTGGSANAVTISGTLTVAGAVVGTPSTLSGAGAIPITALNAAYTSTGVLQALTLANGTNGQVLNICHVLDGGSGLLTPTTANGFSTITFTNAGDSVSMSYFTSGGWCVTGSKGATIA